MDTVLPREKKKEGEAIFICLERITMFTFTSLLIRFQDKSTVAGTEEAIIGVNTNLLASSIVNQAFIVIW